MPERRGFRFALEVLFLAGLAAALSFANLRPLTIGGLMLLGWALVALLEWATWRLAADERRDAPARHLSQTLVLESAALEDSWRSYPAHDDAPTWIASPATLADTWGEWPFGPAAPEPALEDELEEFDPIALLAPRLEADVEESVEPVGVARVATAVRVERHRIDPLREVEHSRLPWRRAVDADAEVAMVPARPEALRVLPLSPLRGD
jgi:hypothetical protein